MSAISTSAQSRKIATDNGWRVVIPEANILTLDIDTPEQLDIFHHNLDVLQNDLQTILKYDQVPSKSGDIHRYHIYMVWPLGDLSVPERIALQASLGSDPLRELNSMMRYIDGDPEPVLLFEAGQ